MALSSGCKISSENEREGSFLPLSVALSTDIERRPDRAKKYRGRGP